MAKQNGVVHRAWQGEGMEGGYKLQPAAVCFTDNMNYHLAGTMWGLMWAGPGQSLLQHACAAGWHV